MISYIRGILTYIGQSEVILETMGIGYEIGVGKRTFSTLPKLGSEVRLYTHMAVREDGISLYGFMEREELILFQKLITVSGVGPKGAIGFFDQFTAKDIILAILTEDTKTLEKAPGVGKKIAQRILLELKDKLQGQEILLGSAVFDVAETMEDSTYLDAIDALMALGYSRSDAVSVVGGVYTQGLSVEEVLKLALKKMAGI